MFHIRDEGETIRSGFNIYPRSSGLIGGIFQIGRYRLVLYKSRKWHFYTDTLRNE